MVAQTFKADDRYGAHQRRPAQLVIGLRHRRLNRGRIAAARPQVAGALLDAHYAILRAELDRFGGREIDTTGDGLFAAFTGPAHAISCACAMRSAPWASKPGSACTPERSKPPVSTWRRSQVAHRLVPAAARSTAPPLPSATAAVATVAQLILAVQLRLVLIVTGVIVRVSATAWTTTTAHGCWPDGPAHQDQALFQPLQPPARLASSGKSDHVVGPRAWLTTAQTVIVGALPAPTALCSVGSWRESSPA